MDENFYPLLMKAATHEDGAAYIGSKAQQHLSDLMQRLGETHHDFIDVKEKTVFGVPISSLVPMEKLEYQSTGLLEDGFTSDASNQTDFEDYIIFPLLAYDGLITQPSYIDSLAISARHGDSAEGLARNVLA